MKRYFFVGLAVIIMAAVSIVAYGAWLNYRGENQITERMANRVLPLKGEKAVVRTLMPRLIIDNANFYSNEMADAVALIDGRITEEFVTKNSMVNKGQVICQLVNDEIPMKLKQADSAVLKAEAELVRAQNTFQRYSKLIIMNATSAEKYDEAEASYRAAIGSLEEAKAQKQQLLVQESRQQVTAPVDGEVLLVYRQRGSYVTAGTSVALIGDFNHLYFTSTIDKQHLDNFTSGDSFELELSRNDYSKVYNTEYRAGNEGWQNRLKIRIAEINPPLSENAAIRKVIWEVDNTGGMLEPQTYTNLIIHSQQQRSCLTVPITAMADSERSQVFVLSSDGLLEKRSIRTGLDDGEYIEILDGIREGDIVITSETEGLHENMKVEVDLEGAES